MTVENNKDVVRKFYEAVERMDFDEAASYCHPDFKFYTQVDTPHAGAQGFIDAEKKNFESFRHFTFPVHDLIGEGDKVVAYIISEASEQIKPLFGLQPTGKSARLSFLMYITMKDGKLIEKRAHFDRLDVIEQLGGGLASA